MAVPPDVREIDVGETDLAYPALKTLRPDISAVEDFVDHVDSVQRPEGYRLVGTFVPSRDDAAAVAGFRTNHSLAWGHFLYVDDFVTLPKFRRQGHGVALVGWIEAEARRLGCVAVHLDSGHQRKDEAHRFYRSLGYDDFGLHFGKFVDR